MMNAVDWLPEFDDSLKPWNKKTGPRGLSRLIYRSCNICHDDFVQQTRFDRFCESYRSDNELYRHADWANYS